MDLNNIISIGELIRKVEINQESVNMYASIPIVFGVILGIVLIRVIFKAVDYYGDTREFFKKNNCVTIILTLLVITSWLMTFLIPMMMIKNENHHIIEQLSYLTNTNQGLRFNLTSVYEKYNEIVSKNDPNEMALLINSNIYILFTQYPRFITKLNNTVVLDFGLFTNLNGLGSHFNVVVSIAGGLIIFLLGNMFFYLRWTLKNIKEQSKKNKN